MGEQGVKSYLVLLALLAGGGPEAVVLEEDVEGVRGRREVGARALSMASGSTFTTGTGRKELERREKRLLGTFFMGDMGAEIGRGIAGAGDSSSTWTLRTWTWNV